MRKDAAFFADVGSMAALLAARGLRRGDRVGFLGQNHRAQVVLLYACMRLSTVLVPLNWRLAEPEWRFICEDAGVSLLLATPDFLQAMPAIDATDTPQAPAPPDVGTEEDALLLVYTSGTTGRPKGAVLDRRAVLRNAAHGIALFGITPADRVLTVLPLFHVGGLNIQTVPALEAGAEILLHQRFDPDAFFDTLARDRPTLTLLVPAVMQALVAHPRWATADLSCLRAIGAGSSDVPLHLIEAFHAKGIPVQQVYGATETCPIAIAQTREEALAAPGSIGRPVPGVEARLDPVTHEILVRGPNIMRGYWNNPEATAAALDADGWFSTGDVGRVDGNGDWWFADRLKHVIISGGENIYPAEVERILRSAPGIAEGAITGRPDPRWGEVPVAVVVPAAGYDAGKVLAHFDGQIARFKQPRAVVTVDALPRTALGKVEMAKLKEIAKRS